jgi:YD repeat-containing protein
MKSFKSFFLVSIIFLATIFSSVALSYAGSGTFDAVLGSDGVVHLTGSASFECPLEGNYGSMADVVLDSYPQRGIATILSGGSEISFDEEDVLSCRPPGNYRYKVVYTGGEWYTNSQGQQVCTISSTPPPMYSTVNLPLGPEISIDAPGERVSGTENIVVSYNFTYAQDSCYDSFTHGDPCMLRYLAIYVGSTGVFSQNGNGGLPLSGTITVPYNFSNLQGSTIIKAMATCGGSRIAEKVVYKDPDDQGNPASNPGSSGSSDDPSKPSQPTQCMGNAGVGKPVNLANGNVSKSETDFSLPGVMPIHFTRYYNSKDSLMKGFGQAWGHTFDTRVYSFGTNTYRVLNPDGSIFYYNDTDGDKVYDPDLPKGVTSRLIKNPNNTFKREFKDGTSEEFNTSGYLTAVVDRNGNRITLTRGTNNTLTKITDPAGREINVTNNVSNKITSITLPDGKVFSYSYPSPGYLGIVTYPGGSTRNYEYVYVSGRGWRLSGIKNEKGNYIEKHTYDSQGRAITSSADGTNEKLTIGYVSDTQSTVTDSLGRVSTYTMDKSKGVSHVTQISGPGCRECGQGNVSYIYDDNLNVTSMTDASGNVTTFSYDANGNILTKTEAYGTALQRTTTYTYDPTFNQVTSITDPLQHITNFNYDSHGNLTSITNPGNATTTFTYNTQGLITQITDALQNPTTLAYDQYGNIATITDSLNNVTSFTYDIMGNLLSVTDANNNPTTYTYDQRGRLAQVRDSLDNLTTYAYDPAGNLTTITDGKGNATQFLYDSINRLIRETNALENQRNYAYDSQSNLMSKTDANGQTITYSYDDHNRLVTIDYPVEPDTTFTYDPLGNLTGATNQNISYAFAHDALNRKTSVSDSLNRTLSYTYDANSNRLTMTDPVGTIQYAYNLLNLATAISNSIGQVSYSYDNLGRRTSLSLPNQISTTYTYDSLSRLLSIINGSISTNSYAYDNVGNRTSMTEQSGTHNYAYDIIYRLLQATHPAPPTEQFTYDQVGNRLTDGSDNSYFYNNANRLLNYNGVTFTYDSNGNVTSKTDSCGTTTYTWDSEDRSQASMALNLIAQP